MKSFCNGIGQIWLGSIFLFTIFGFGQLASDGLAVVPKWLIMGSLFCVFVSFAIGDRQDRFLLHLCCAPVAGAVFGMSLGLQQLVGAVGAGATDIDLFLSAAREMLQVAMLIFFSLPLLALPYAIVQRRTRIIKSTQVAE